MCHVLYIFTFGVTSHQWTSASLFTRFLITHNDAPHSVKLLWRVISSSQRPLPDSTQHPQQTDFHAPGGFLTHNLSRRTAVDRAATGTGCVYINPTDIY